AGRVSYDEALDALACADAHTVVGLPDNDGGAPLGAALSALRGLGEQRFRLVLPVPGDVAGLPAVPALTVPALRAGQAVTGDRLALVPERAGPEALTWTAAPLDGIRSAPPVEGSLRSAAGALDLAVRDAARTLAGLDLARWHPEVPALLAELGRPATGLRLPPDHDPLAVQILARAQRLAAVLELATTDAPGAAVTSAQMTARADALRPLSAAVRKAITAAYNAVPR
ncbi:MAG: hypothetical protein ACXVXS_07990, partial [Blastococcus sp.]